MMAAEQLNNTKPLAALFAGCNDTAVHISGLATDSREVKPGDLFLACRGLRFNGVDYIDDAIRLGAVAVAIDGSEQLDTVSIPVPVVRVPALHQQAGNIISRFYDEPSKRMRIFGVTGTNGKTTVSYMIAYTLSRLGQDAGLIGTLGYGLFGDIKASNMTTPDMIKLHSLFYQWRRKVDSVAMEVSSHALDQGRVTGIAFNVAILTNISRDHLDYHTSLEDYAAAKFRLFECTGLEYAIVNAGDDYGARLIEKLPEDVHIIACSDQFATIKSVKKGVDRVWCEAVERDHLASYLSIQSPWGKAVVRTRLLGQFNIENILAVFAALCATGIRVGQLEKTLSDFEGVPGRMECFSAADKPLLVVDYAHTPDALRKTLSTLRHYCAGRLYCVFGCGGDRDIGKRPQMGAVAEALADRIVLTNDNPRSEPPTQIIEHILTGINRKDRIIVKEDRNDAINDTFLMADKEDVILIAGKGHETTQVIGSTALPFSDRELAKSLTAGGI